MREDTAASSFPSHSEARDDYSWLQVSLNVGPKEISEVLPGSRTALVSGS